MRTVKAASEMIHVMTTKSPRHRPAQPRSKGNMTAWNASYRCWWPRWLSSRSKGTEAFAGACGRPRPARARAGSEARRPVAAATIWPQRSHIQGLASLHLPRTPWSSPHHSSGALVIPENINVTLAIDEILGFTKFEMLLNLSKFS